MISQDDTDSNTKFPPSVQKRRQRLLNYLQNKSLNEKVMFSKFKTSKIKNKDNFRGSSFRGISKNGKTWQIMIMVNGKKKYLGILSNQEQAARFYDRVAIQYHGIKARTNFTYTRNEVEIFLSMRPYEFQTLIGSDVTNHRTQESLNIQV